MSIALRFLEKINATLGAWHFATWTLHFHVRSRQIDGSRFVAVFAQHSGSVAHLLEKFALFAETLKEVGRVGFDGRFDFSAFAIMRKHATVNEEHEADAHQHKQTVVYIEHIDLLIAG